MNWGRKEEERERERERERESLGNILQAVTYERKNENTARRNNYYAVDGSVKLSFS